MKERTDYVQNNLPLLSTISLLMCFSVFGYCVVYHRLKARERERFVLKSALPVKVCLIIAGANSRKRKLPFLNPIPVYDSENARMKLYEFKELLHTEYIYDIHN